MVAGELQFKMQHQDQTHWCWAATASSIRDYYEPETVHPQCFLVEDEFGESTCCEDGSAPTCNKREYMNLALEKVNHYGGSEPGPVSLLVLAAEINAGRPVVANISWQGGGTHFPVITGYMETPGTGDPLGFLYPIQTLKIQDPVNPLLLDYEILIYEIFRDLYHGTGAWTYTFFTR